MATAFTRAGDSSDIAIVGIALRFPGAHGADEFWSNLRGGVESIRQFTDSELAARGVPSPLLCNPAYVKSGFVLEGVDQFDAGFFGFSPREAAMLDPQHRQFLECAWEALEDAGHPPATFRGPIGVFAGCGMGSYFTFNLISNPALVESVGMFMLRHTGNDKDFLTTRVSYCLDLKGPSINIQTACSTSLVAVHAASQSLLAGECDMALAGGVSVEIPHGVGYLCREGEILSPDGHCRPFDHRAKGTIFGSGVGIVALRRVEDALRDGDRIYAVVKGSAVNNDGAGKVSYLAPSVDGQAAVIAEALASADVEAGTIEFIETHGSGTRMGEPIEVAALAQVFRRSAWRKDGCGLGSVKANIGHLDTAAGVAGLIKVALALHHEEIPPTPNFEAPNRELRFEDTPFYVVDRARPWPRDDASRATPRRAGVTALGVGGTNAHVVLEQAPAAAPVSTPRRPWQLLCLSAKTAKSLDESTRSLATHLRAHPPRDLADIAFTLYFGRQAFEHRRVLCCRDPAEAAALLESLDPRRVFTQSSAKSPPSVVFLLPGGGAQHARMGRELYASEPIFREEIDRGIDELLRRTGRDLRALWRDGSSARGDTLELQRPSFQLPAIFILEHALAQLWRAAGVRPDALIGHSLGENTAACLAGVFSFEDALGLIALRGELFEELHAGGMLSVALSPDDLAPWLGSDLEIAAVNAPEVTVVSGPTAAVDDLARRLAAKSIDAQRVAITTAAHSHLVDPIVPRFLAHLRTMQMHRPRIPFVSNRTGTWITPEEAVTPEYWADHLRHRVRFADGIRTILADPARVLLEVGPGQTLSSLARQAADSNGAHAFVASMRHAEEAIADSARFLTAVGRLWASGVEIDPDFLWGGERRRRVTLPTYAFERERHWIEPGKPIESGAAPSEEPAALDLLREGFYRPAWKARPLPSAEPPQDRQATCTWLLFLDSAGLGRRLALALRARGDKVITVCESDDNRRLGAGEYALAPERGREGYTDLVRDLVALGSLPDRIVHLWLLTPDASFRPGSNFFHRNQERGFYSLFFLAQALGDEDVKAPLHVTVVGNGLHALESETLLHPSKATILGPCRVIPREFPGVTCSTLDVSLANALNRRGELRPERLDALVEIVKAEILSAPRCAHIAHREERRLEEEFERIALPPAGSNGQAPLREHGVYLITGGLGALGLAVASDFARRARARLVLVSRSGLPDRSQWDAWLTRHPSADPVGRSIRAVRQIEAAGAEVLVACADVADVERMRDLIAETQRRFGALHGVVHAAGVLRDGPLLAKTQEIVEEVFAPKVHGTLVLDALLRDVDLDFFVLFSSTSAVVAPAGQVDYVAANAFMDAYARSSSEPTPSSNGHARNSNGHSRVALRKHRQTISVNWGIWREVGMAADALHAPIDPKSRSANGTAPRHPLFDSRGGDPDLPLRLEARYRPTTHWILDQHRTLEGRAILPGAAYPEMARAALVEAGEKNAFEMRDLLLLLPLHIPDGDAREVQVDLRADAEGYFFSVQSRAPVLDASEGWETCAQARLLLHTLPHAAPVSLAEIEGRCPRTRQADGPRALPSKQMKRVRFGPRWENLREVRCGRGEVLATLELDDEFKSDLDHYALHPSLLDIAVSCGLELPELSIDEELKDDLWAPVSYHSVRVHRRLTPRIKSWVRSRETNSADSTLLVFDVVVLDSQERVCVEIDEIVLRRVSRELHIDTSSPARFEASVQSSEHGARNTVMNSDQTPSKRRSALERNLQLGIEVDEGVEALQRILGASGLTQVVATSLDLDGLRREAETLAVAPNGNHLHCAEQEEKTTLGRSSDGIERTLMGLWRELLGVRSVGLHDSFFDLGGHSLIAVRLFARIKKKYQIEFPISLLFEAPTIERCAEAIRRARGNVSGALAIPTRVPAPRYKHLVPMHPGQGGSGTPFFLVAGMFGNVLNLRHLAHLLGNDRRFFGLQALGLYGTDSPHETFEAMARDYLAELRDVQPSGPYLLGGFSGGGITAYEMALQLLEAGEQVAFLGMLDTALPQAPRLHVNEKARIHWERIRRRGAAYATEWARDRLRWEMSRIHERRRATHAAGMVTEFRSDEIGAAFRRALQRYQLRRFSATLTLFRPRLEIAHVLGPGRVTNSRREFVFEDNGWGPHVDHVEIHEVPGDHDSMVLEPNVRVLAARMRTCIRAAESNPQGLARRVEQHVAES